MQRLLEKINAHPRATLIVAGTTVFGAVAVVILLMFLSLRDSVVNPVVSPEEEKMVLSEVIKNNASGLINNNQNTTTVPNTGNTPIPIPAEPTPNGLGNSNPNASQPEVPVAPDINEYNYRVTRTTKQVGPAYSACKMYGYGYGGYGPGYPGEGSDVDNVSEYYEYFERYLTIYKQQVTEDGKLTLFNINKYGKSVNSSTYYLEGDYAVENIFKSYSQFDNQQDTQTISYPNWSLDEYVSNYFGKDAAIIEVKTDSNGVKHYLIRSTYTSYCDPSYDPYLVSDEIVPPVQRTIINIYSVNGKTFSIEQIKKYIDSVKDENLIDVTTTEINRSKVNYSQVNAQFTINSSVQLIKNDYSNLVYNYNPINRINTALDFLSESDSHILLPSEKDGLGYLWVNGFEPNDYVDTMQFYKDRDFFPSNAWGDTLFDRYNSHLNYNSKFDYTVSLSMGTDKGYSISAYKQDVVMDDIIAEIMATRSTSKSIVDAQFIINGEAIDVKKIVRVSKYNYPTSYMVSYPVSYTDNSNTSYYTYYLFEYNDRVYSVSYYNYMNLMNIDFKGFNTYAIDNQEALANVKTMMEEMYYIYQGFFGPVSYPTSFPVSYSY